MSVRNILADVCEYPSIYHNKVILSFTIIVNFVYFLTSYKLNHRYILCNLWLFFLPNNNLPFIHLVVYFNNVFTLLFYNISWNTTNLFYSVAEYLIYSNLNYYEEIHYALVVFGYKQNLA